MRYEIQPLGQWLDPNTEPRVGSHRFRASWQDTLNRELGLLGACGGLFAALKATHPDRPGGSRDAFDRVQDARRVLGL